MLEKFTRRTRKVIERAQKEALSFSHSHLGTEHLLLGLSGERAFVAAGVLCRLGVKYDEAREQVESVEGYGRGAR
jgi:ATP-dependent Clp protease ATP-binding subunit ClpC